MKDYAVPLLILGALGVGAFLWMGSRYKAAPPPGPRVGPPQGGVQSPPGPQGPLDGITSMAGQISVALSGILSDKRVQGGIASLAEAGGKAAGAAAAGAIEGAVS